MCTNTRLNTIMQQMAEIYRSAYGNKLVEVYLYGSYARGNFTAESDIDVAAIVDDTRENMQKSLYMVWDKSAEIGLENDIIISPVAIPKSEFVLYGNSLPYYRNIRKDGKKIEYSMPT